MQEQERQLRAYYAEAKASAALEGSTPPLETADLRESWLSGFLTFDEYLTRLNEHYRAKGGPRG